jgi:hypothetical protein
MKNSISAILFGAIISVAASPMTPVFAGPISSGGVPPTPYALRKMQLDAVLNSQELRVSLGNLDGITSVRFVGFKESTWQFAVSNGRCEAVANVTHEVDSSSAVPQLNIRVQVEACR